MDINSIGNFKNFLKENKLNEGLSTNVSLTRRNGPEAYVEELEESLRLDGLAISDIAMATDEGKFTREQFSMVEQKWKTLENALIYYVKYTQSLEEIESTGVPQNKFRKESNFWETDVPAAYDEEYQKELEREEENEDLDFWDRYEDEEDMDESIEMLEEEIGRVESDIEYLERTTDQSNRKENAGKIAELKQQLQSLRDELDYINR